MDWQELLQQLTESSDKIELGGGLKAIDRQHKKGRMTARERIDALLDDASSFLEIGRWSAWEMYAEWGGATSASVICGMGKVSG